MVRVPLEELVLQIHALRLGPAAQFLERVLEPPPPRSVAGALAQLAAIGALTPDERLTPLGAVLLRPPHHALLPHGMPLAPAADVMPCADA
jgi:HrpA-like RNA helicase